MSEEPIVSTRDKPGTYDALETAKADELVFTLQSGDPFSVPTIIFWADLARTAGRTEPKADVSAKLLKKATEAEMVAWAFKDWQAGRGAVVIAEAKRYESEDVTDHNVIRARASERLNNALSEALGVAEKLDAAGIEPEAASDIICAVETLRRASENIEPRRHIRGAK